MLPSRPNIHELVSHAKIMSFIGFYLEICKNAKFCSFNVLFQDKNQKNVRKTL